MLIMSTTSRRIATGGGPGTGNMGGGAGGWPNPANPCGGGGLTSKSLGCGANGGGVL